MTQQGTNNNIKHQAGQFGLEKMLGNLTEKGYDVSAIQTAVTNGDYKNAMTLMKEFRTAHPDAFPVHARDCERPDEWPDLGKQNTPDAQQPDRKGV